MRFFLTVFCICVHSLFGADSIGKVIAVEGLVKALAESKERVLNKGSDIFVKDTIVVSSEASAQVRFTDGGILNLIPDTEFYINEYKYKKIFQKDLSKTELVRGGLRALSGTIAKKNPNEYEIKTPSATIGLRGTIVEATIVGSSLYVGIDKGKALVSNGSGQTMIGVGEAQNFAFVPSDNFPPELRAGRPPELSLNIFTPPPGGLSIDLVETQKSRAAKSTPKVSKSTTSQSGASITESDQGTTSTTESDYQQIGGGASIQGGC